MLPSMFVCTISLDASPKLSDLMNDVAAKLSAREWKAFAVQLGLKYECIRKIQNENTGNTPNMFMEVFHEWSIQRTTPYTWETVINALSSPSLKEIRLAKTLSEKYIDC